MDNSIDLSACKIQRHRNRLDFVKKVSGLKSLNDLSDYFSKEANIALNLNGKGVLHKQIENTSVLTSLQFAQSFPGANMNDFYIQNFRSGLRSFISVIRKTEADRWLTLCSNLGLNPLMLSLGPFPVHMIAPQLNVYGDTLIFDGHLIIRTEELDWESYRYDRSLHAPFPLKIENEVLEEQLLLAYSSAFQLLFAHFAETVQAHVPQLDKDFKLLISSKRTKVAVAGALLAFFVILLINSVVLWSVNAENRELSNRVNRSVFGTREHAALAGLIKSKEAQLQELGWNGHYNKAVLIDQLALNLPDEVSWNELAINPLDLTGSRNLQQVLFNDRTIKITGSSKRIVPVNNWMSELEKIPWVRMVKLESYTYNQESETGEFVLLINF
ncbi:PilN domain-containing protein [Desertivirga xinjiangensis]|uniref:PilN domain-containing protein n=1 Tax=Desertivirga xinjiangensis TaxID=539206 RepID=UPI00210CD4BB|nr:PilN domain-containing protein [Pedobacter xinjiangensis]